MERTKCIRDPCGQQERVRGVTNMALLMDIFGTLDRIGIIFKPLRRDPQVAEPTPPNTKPRFGVRTLMTIAVGLVTLHVLGQSGSNLRVAQVIFANDSIRLDSLSIAPGSFSLWDENVRIEPSAYTVDPYGAWLVRKDPALTDTLTARWRALPLLLSGTYRHKDPDRLTKLSGERPDPFKYSPSSSVEDPFGISGLNKSGSISRGVLAGNNQDLSVNSTLNLELSGRLTDRISILASITDNNIPIQVGGNTLELQDFDQVFIKLFDDRQELVAGDFVLQRPNSHFLTYLKKAKGLSYGTKLGPVTKPNGQLGVSAAVSKGKFARNVIQGTEGVQGPYRLRGDAGENFIIVLSGTERVFIDGLQLSRGQENDYVIDYNTAEVTFTAKRLITKDRRIVVEFQYSEKNYVRSLLRASFDRSFAKTDVHFNLYTEQDHRNQPLQQELSPSDRTVLTEAGDDPLAAATPGVDTVAFSTNEVLYAKRDSLGYDPVYVYNTSPDSAFYRLTFTTVGTGNGDYVQDSFSPNGRVFRWVAPDTVDGNIVRRGDSAPLRILVAPRAQQVLAMGAEHRFSARTKASAEIALSNNDVNTFSSIGNGDNKAPAFRLGGVHQIPLSAKDSTWRMELTTENELLGRDFKYVERYRAVEFERNWNALGIALDGDQLLASVGVGVRSYRGGYARLTANTFQVRDRYIGWRERLESDLHLGRWDLVGEASLLSTTEPRRTQFLRHKGMLRHRTRDLALGVKSEQEHNLFMTQGSDSLMAGSYQFHDWELFVQSPDSFKTRVRLSGGQRYEKGLRNGMLSASTVATAYGATLDLTKDPRNRLSTTFTFRELRIADSTITVAKPEETYLARVDYDLSLWKGAMNWDMFYEFGSGLEQRREYIYVQVPAGQGVYIWIDYNGNGIKELNEFEVANFGYEADHIRVFVQTNDYVRTFSNQLSTSLDMRPAAVWEDTKGVRHFVAKFSDLASFRTDRKTGADDLGQAVNPFKLDPLDSALTAFNSSVRNTFYYDRSSRIWSVDHTYQNDRTKSLLQNGYESRTREGNTLRLRVNATRHWTLEIESERGRSTSNSDLIEGRNFKVDQESIRPRLTWQPGTRLRAVVTYKLTRKLNDIDLGGEQAELQDLGAELRFNAAGKGTIQLNGNLVGIAFDGTENSVIGNEMLGGLRAGTNITWSLGIQRRLSDHLQVDLTYNGRSSEGVPTVHVGGAQVRAFF